MEAFMGWYGADTYDWYVMFNRMTGPYNPIFWTVILVNIVALQALWFKSVRRNLLALWILAWMIQTAMWFERYMIIITSLHHDFLPRSWGMYSGTFWDWLIFIGTWGLFLFCFLLFLRYVPMITIFEMRQTAHRAETRGGHA
jgi:hypothetical protein